MADVELYEIVLRGPGYYRGKDWELALIPVSKKTAEVYIAQWSRVQARIKDGERVPPDEMMPYAVPGVKISMRPVTVTIGASAQRNEG